MLRMALCDDERSARESLYIELERVIWEDSEQIVYEFSSGNSAVNWLEKHPGEIDLLFLDMEMKGMNGLETAKEIRKFDRELMIVFVTGYADYVFDGYSVGAVDYLMKPISGEKLQAVFERIRAKISREEQRMFTLKNADGTYRFALKDILYFYSERRKVMLVTEKGEYGFYEKLDELERKLEAQAETTGEVSAEITGEVSAETAGGASAEITGEVSAETRRSAGHDISFVRIHQRYLVNAQKVEHIGSTSVTIGGQEFPVSRACKESALRKLAEAMLGGVG